MAIIGQFTARRGGVFVTAALRDDFQWECPDNPGFGRIVNALFPATADDRGPQAGQPGAGLIHRAAEHWGGVVLMLMAPGVGRSDVVY